MENYIYVKKKLMRHNHRLKQLYRHRMKIKTKINKTLNNKIKKKKKNKKRSKKNLAGQLKINKRVVKFKIRRNKNKITINNSQLVRINEN